MAKKISRTSQKPRGRVRSNPNEYNYVVFDADGKGIGLCITRKEAREQAEKIGGFWAKAANRQAVKKGKPAPVSRPATKEMNLANFRKAKTKRKKASIYTPYGGGAAIARAPRAARAEVHVSGEADENGHFGVGYGAGAGRSHHMDAWPGPAEAAPARRARKKPGVAKVARQSADDRRFAAQMANQYARDRRAAEGDGMYGPEPIVNPARRYRRNPAPVYCVFRENGWLASSHKNLRSLAENYPLGEPMLRDTVRLFEQGSPPRRIGGAMLDGGKLLGDEEWDLLRAAVWPRSTASRYRRNPKPSRGPGQVALEIGSYAVVAPWFKAAAGAKGEVIDYDYDNGDVFTIKTRDGRVFAVPAEQLSACSYDEWSRDTDASQSRHWAGIDVAGKLAAQDRQAARAAKAASRQSSVRPSGPSEAEIQRARGAELAPPRPGRFHGESWRSSAPVTSRETRIPLGVTDGKRSWDPRSFGTVKATGWRNKAGFTKDTVEIDEENYFEVMWDATKGRWVTQAEWHGAFPIYEAPGRVKLDKAGRAAAKAAYDASVGVGMGPFSAPRKNPAELTAQEKRDIKARRTARMADLSAIRQRAWDVAGGNKAKYIKLCAAAGVSC